MPEGSRSPVRRRGAIALTLAIAPAWGRTGSAADQLWSAHDARALGADSEFEADSRIAIDARYGFGFAPEDLLVMQRAGRRVNKAADADAVEPGAGESGRIAVAKLLAELHPEPFEDLSSHVEVGEGLGVPAGIVSEDLNDGPVDGGDENLGNLRPR